ncbi:MAG: M20/M25/M40 family metallo-hydrolase [Gemmatimonadota bacterium]
MTGKAAAILAHLEARRDEMTELLVRLAEQETPTRDRASQAPVLDMLGAELEAAGLETLRLSGRATGGNLFARPALRVPGRPFQLLIGHCDTVWARGTLETMPVRVEGDVLRGPGVFDMKGGLVHLLYALRTLHDLELTPPVTPVVFINSDEEQGSPESWRHIDRLARRARRAFVLEPALGLDGRLKTARKGVGHFVIRVVGRSAHGGLEPEAGASAIFELSHVIQTLYRLADPERGVTVNVGEIQGGTAANVVAAASRAVVDVRVPDHEAARTFERAIHDLQPVTPGTRLEIEGRIGRPPMERTPRNQALWRAAERAADELGIEIEQGTSGGASDGNITSRHTATLDGLGPVGDGAHAVHEFVRLDRMPERTALLALLLLAPEQAPEPGKERHP